MYFQLKRLHTFFLFISCFVATTQAQTISTFAGNRTVGFSGDGGQATAAALNSPSGITVSAAGDVYIADLANNRVRKITSTGIITTVAGSGTAGNTGDGGAATAAKLDNPMSVAIDAAGNLFIADYNNAKVRKVNTSGIISTVVGTGTIGFAADGAVATAANIAKPTGIAFDASGNLLVVESNNNLVRRINASGTMTTVAGGNGSGFTGDGGAATAAKISYPFSVLVDAAGNMIILDNGNFRVRKVTASGIISTIAGNGTSGFSGDGGAATSASFNNASGIAFDASGNLLIADQNNNRVRKVTTAGIISTYAGSATGGYSGDGGAATACTFYKPSALAIASGIVYIADMGNAAIRKITTSISHNPSFTGGTVQTLGLCTSASATAINTQMAINDMDASQTETWTVTLAPAHGTLAGFPRTATSTGGIVTPSGLTYTPTTGYTGTDSFKIQVSDGALTGTTTIKITATAAPSVAAITGATTVCIGNAITLANATTGGSWSSANVSIASVTSAGIVTGIAAGVTNISYTITNACGTAVATKADTVKSFPAAGVISGVSAQCAGTTITLTTTGSGGSWTTSNVALATVTAAGVVTGIAAGVVTVSYTVSNSCGTSSAFKTDTVKAGSALTPIYGYAIGAVCIAQTNSLLNATSGGTWSSSAPAIASVSSSGIVTGIALGTAVISYAVTSSCGSGVATQNVTVGPTPNAGMISGPAIVANGATITLTSTVAGGAWSSGAPTKATVSATGIVTGLSAGIAYISYTVTNSCGSAVTAMPVTVPYTSALGSNTIVRYAGNYSSGYSGDGGAATAAALNHGAGMAVDNAGNIYIADQANHRIRKVTPTGIITTVAGSGTAGATGDGGAATAAKLSSPSAVAVDAAGNIYIADYENAAVRKVNTSGIISKFAGNYAPGYTADGAAASTSAIAKPLGIAVDVSGNVYFSEQNNHIIRKVNTSGILTTLAGNRGPGYSGDNGLATAAVISYPGAMVVDQASGILYFIDGGNQRVRRITPGGLINLVAGNGTAAYSGDGGPATAASLNNPAGIFFDSTNYLLVADQGNQRIRKLTASGLIATIAGTGAAGSSGDGGPATAAKFYNPAGIVGYGGSIYVADMGNSVVRKIINTIVGNAPGFTNGTTQSLAVCTGVTTSISARQEIGDADAGQTETWTVVSAPAHGTLTGFPATATSTGSTITPGTLNYTPATGYTGSDSIRIRISDGSNSATTLINITVNASTAAGTISGPSKLCTAAGAWTTFTSTVAGGVWTTDNPAVANIDATTGAAYPNSAGSFGIKYTVTNGCGVAVTTKIDTAIDLISLDNITGPGVVAVGATITLANTYLTGAWASSNNTIASVTTGGVVRGNANGMVTISLSATNYCGTTTTTKPITVGTLASTNNIYNFAGAGNGSAGLREDGIGANTRIISGPAGVAKDRNGFIYFAEQGNSLVRKVDQITGNLVTVAGTTVAGFSGDGGPATAAKINGPSAVAVDSVGNVYIADYNNYRIRKVNTSGIITTIAGTGANGFTASNVAATSAALTNPTGIAVDRAGNVYFAEQSHHRVLKISTSGLLTIAAGNNSASFSGDGGAATAAALSYPAGVYVSAASELYIADAGNNRIRKVTAAGVITTIAGNGAAGYTGNGGAATAAKLNNPYGITTDSLGNIYIADRNNNVIRSVNTSGIISTFAGTGTAGYAGDQYPATVAYLYAPQGMVCAGSNMYIADFANNDVRVVGKVTYMYHGPYSPIFAGFLTPCKNSAPVQIDSFLTVTDLDLSQVDTFKIRNAPLHGTVTGLVKTVATNGDLITPANVFYTPASNYVGPDTFVIKICDRFDSANISFFVNVVAAPVVSAISGAATVAISTPITLTDATAGGVWSSNNTAIASVSTVGLVKGMAVGAATISYTVANGCGSSFVTKAVSVTAGREFGGWTADEPDANDIIVYPNPANGELSIAAPAGAEGIAVRIVDMVGKVVYQSTSTATNGLLAIPTNTWESGMYIVKVNSGGLAVSRLIKVEH